MIKNVRVLHRKPPVALSMIESRIAKIGNPLNLQAIAVLIIENN
jgi:hypothetical protein